MGTLWLGRRASRVAGAAVLVGVGLFSVGCAGAGRWVSVPDDRSGPVATARVDSEAARQTLTDLLQAPSGAARFAARAGGMTTDSAQGRWVPDRAWLRDLGATVSTDYAALTFVRLIGADDRRRLIRAAFDRFVGEGPAHAEEQLRRPGAFPYTLLLVPAWLYRTKPDTGAGFARHRRMLERLGIPYRLVSTAESGSVEHNGAIVAKAVREARRAGEMVMLVSASKSGAEVALALSRALEPGETEHVRGWLNVAGALRGTPLADRVLRAPAAWFARAFFGLKGWDWAGAASMATERSRRRLEGARLPPWIAVVNLIGVPVSGTVGRRVWGGYFLAPPSRPQRRRGAAG
jgi:hypothetical protein